MIAEHDGNIAGVLMAFGDDAAHDSGNFHWFRQRHEEFLYIDRIAVAGDSAGANLAAVMAHLARDNADNGGPALAFQLLWYPTVCADMSLPSFTENATAPVLDLEVIDAFLGHAHLGEEAFAPTSALGLRDLRRLAQSIEALLADCGIEAVESPCA